MKLKFKYSKYTPLHEQARQRNEQLYEVEVFNCLQTLW